MTHPRQIFGLFQNRICFSAKTDEEPSESSNETEAEVEDSLPGSGSQPGSGELSSSFFLFLLSRLYVHQDSSVVGSQSIPYYLPSSPESLNSQPRSTGTRSSGSEFYKSINRVFSSTHVRDPGFPETPPRHHTPDALPRPKPSRLRVPPLDYTPYIRPAILNPYSDIYSPRSHHSAHLIHPMSSFAADLTLALEAIEDEEEEATNRGQHRRLYGIQHTPPPEGQRDLTGLYRPLYTDAPTSSVGSRESRSIALEGRKS